MEEANWSNGKNGNDFVLHSEFPPGTLNRNTQQSDEGEHKAKKRKEQQKADSSDDADQY